MVKNEADIIELFIKINSRVFEKLYILDHNSEDRTAEIVRLMQGKGYPVELIRLTEEEPAYNQAEITTRFVNRIARDKDHDYLMPIDGDEFLHFSQCQCPADILSGLIPQGEFGIVRWKTYCPRKSGFLTTEAPLYHNFEARSREPRQYHKVILSRELAKTCRLEMGNHRLSEPADLPARWLPITLQHVPVRSPEQIASKAIIGSKALALKADRKKDEGTHWDEIMAIVKAGGMKLSHSAALRIAIDYATDKGTRGGARLPLFPKAPRIGLPEDTIEHKDLAVVDLEQNLRLFDERLAGADGRRSSFP